ncbi:hypothetical protein [Ectobacillus funiculus]|uniref:Uncharacterized protein n=1 Tax=Ectobacillus funiculus TaxID=137993 RepID=A0ABV5WM05_9BACI
MNIIGEVFKKRLYQDWENGTINFIFFMNVYEGVMIKGDRVSTIPMLIADEIIDYKIGDKIKIEGIIEFRRIITPSGKLSFSPLPIIIPYSHYQLSYQ